MELSDIINKIGEKKQEFDSLGEFLPQNERKLWEKLRLEWNYNSNHIEGNTLSYGETKLLLIFGQTNGNHEVRDLDEMRAHDAAIQLVREWANDKNHILTENDIRNLNKIILVRDFWKDALTPDSQKTRRKIVVGSYKEYPNSVITQTGELFEYASPADTPILMKELVDWYRNETKDIHPLIIAATLHYRFVRIHPFDDGNGRIARILANYHLLKSDYPPIIIKSEDKKNYLFALNRADAGNLDSFIEYIGQSLLWSIELNIKAKKGEELEEEGDFKKEVDILRKKIKAKAQSDDFKIEKLKNDRIFFIRKNFKPIVLEFANQMLPFSHLFENFHFEVSFPYNINSETSYSFFNNPDTAFDEAYINECIELFTEFFEIRYDEFQIWKINISCDLKGLKELKDSDFQTGADFSVFLNDDHFQIGHLSKLQFKEDYSYQIQKEDLKFFRVFRDYIFTQIEEIL